MVGSGYTKNWKHQFMKILFIVIWAIIIGQALLLSSTQVVLMRDDVTVDVVNFNGTLINSNPNYQKLPKILNGPSYMDWYTQHY